MKMVSVKQAILMSILAVALFLLVTWGSYLVRGEIALGGELFIPLIVIGFLGEIFGEKEK